MNVEQIATDVAQKTLKVAEATVKKAWSIMDAASEKPSPSQYLTPQAIRAIQGMRGQDGK